MRHTPHAQIMIPLLLCCNLSFGAELVTMNGPRPVAALASELGKRYGYLITYEEAPYSNQELTSESRPNGTKFVFPRSSSMTFDVATAPLGTMAQGGVPSASSNIVQHLLDQYNQSLNPQRFSAIYDGQFTHIIPITRNVNGKAETFVPMLSTSVSFTTEAHQCHEILTDLLNQIGRSRGMTVVPAVVPMNNLMNHECSVQGGTSSARNILSQILDQIVGSNYPSDLPKPRYVWSLCYDANIENYFISITPVFQKVSQQAL